MRTPLRTLRRWDFMGLGLTLTLLMCSCARNPMAPGTPSASTTNFSRPAEPMNVSGLFFAPQSVNGNQTLGFVPGSAASGAAYLDFGTNWIDYTTLGAPYNLAFFGPNVWLRNGVSGTNPAGDAFSSNPNDYYLRFQGKFTGTGLPNPSLDYNELNIYYNNNSGPGVDVSRFRGFSFYVRGSGNFSVTLISGSQDGNPAAPGPYIQLNFYQDLFNSYLTGPTQWKQVSIYFSQMTQTYGLATNLQQVLQNFYGLQFIQTGSPAPVIKNFTMDLDYIRFF